MRFFCQRAVHRVVDRNRFDAEWTEKAYTHPDFVADSPAEAVEWLESTVAAQVERLTPAQRARSGYDDERFERMGDGWREATARGDMTGTVVGAGDGYVAHVHVFPERER